MTEKQILKNIEKQVKAYFALEKKKPKQKRLKLMEPYYDHQEVMQVVDSLLRRELTLNHKEGNKVQRFEELWAKYIGKKEGVMMNSGSSSNLLALEVLRNPLVKNHLKPGDEIITPALTWNTSVTPMWAMGFVPVLVDVDPETFTIKVEDIEKAITPKTRAIMPVHLLGHPCNMEEIMRIAKRHDLFVIEDCCEAHGAEIQGKKAGSFGHLSTFSFFFSHHLTTMEGGMVLADDPELAEILRTIRSEGVMRNSKHAKIENRYYDNPKYSDIQKAFLWTNIGYNTRPTQINGGFGLVQFKKFPKILKARRDNADAFIKLFKKYSDYISMPQVARNIKHAWFAVPITVKPGAPFTRRELESFLNQKGIETRQIMAGDITKQPAFEIFPSRVVGDLKNTKAIHESSFFFGNHPLITAADKKYVVQCMEEFLGTLK
jgi:CDP-6-deoxy-D-xylo-4-hexulose-3-dehydrase